MFGILKKWLGPPERGQEEIELEELVGADPERIRGAVRQHLSASDAAVLLLSLPPELNAGLFKEIAEERRQEMEEAIRGAGPLSQEARRETLGRILRVLRGQL